ncbi:unnamed protein product [Peniophora sp. CBMAI 1063]|nr:unnamed protein product [Peniophora sp. CBMAI 1063]
MRSLSHLHLDDVTKRTRQPKSRSDDKTALPSKNHTQDVTDAHLVHAPPMYERYIPVLPSWHYRQPSRVQLSSSGALTDMELERLQECLADEWEQELRMTFL